MLIVAFDNKILAMEACHQTSQALVRVEPEWKQEVSLHSNRIFSSWKLKLPDGFRTI